MAITEDDRVRMGTMAPEMKEANLPAHLTKHFNRLHID